MNIYVRYFDHENVFANGEQIVQFLVSLHDFHMTPQLQNEILTYAQNNMPYPKRVKVRNNVYFILIKTTAVDLADFKAHRKTTTQNTQAPETPQREERRDERMEELKAERIGWYKSEVKFKRVVLVPGTQKCNYRDTTFSAYIYAKSGLDCYHQTIDHLRNRQDIDPRSQYPSEKKGNYVFTFLGNKVPDRN